MCGNSAKESNNTNDTWYYVIKFALFTYCFFWLTIGSALLAIGIYAEVERQRYKSLHGAFLAPSIILILQGLVMFVVSLIGAIGSLRDNRALLKTFMYTLAVCLVVQLLGGIVVLVLRTQTTEVFSKVARKGMKNYYDDLDFKNIMDYVQKKFRCCGAQDFKDWKVNMYHNCSAPGPLACGVPHTCCFTSKPGEVVNTFCGYKALEKEHPENIYVVGCTDAFLSWVKDNFVLAGGFLLGILVPQIFGIVCSWLYIPKTRDFEYSGDRDPKGPHPLQSPARPYLTHYSLPTGQNASALHLSLAHLEKAGTHGPHCLLTSADCFIQPCCSYRLPLHICLTSLGIQKKQLSHPGQQQSALQGRDEAGGGLVHKYS
uniref:Tetraspanin-15 n=1 Tax=Oryzias latipes TaxID=8090 RepID=A0A3P9IRP4_ORYLA